MKALHLLAMSAAIAALPFLAVTQTSAQQRPVGGGARITFPGHSNHFSWERGHGFHGGFHGFPGVIIVERPFDYAQDERKPVIVEREVVREVSVTPPPAANSGTLNRDVPGLPAKRKPYVVGASYASLPGGCMKLIEEGVSYYWCGGEWYRQVGSGRSATYRAIRRSAL